MTRTVGIAVAAILLVAAPATPSAGAGACKKFTPSVSESQSGEHDEARDAKVVTVTDSATEDRPLIFEYAHGPGLDMGASYPVVIADGVFFNFQVGSARPTASVNLRAEWATPSHQDVELYLYDSHGHEVAASASFNAVPAVYNADDDDNGLEQIIGFGALRCEGLTLESQGGITTGVDVALSVWLD